MHWKMLLSLNMEETKYIALKWVQFNSSEIGLLLNCQNCAKEKRLFLMANTKRHLSMQLKFVLKLEII